MAATNGYLPMDNEYFKITEINGEAVEGVAYSAPLHKGGSFKVKINYENILRDYGEHSFIRFGGVTKRAHYEYTVRAADGEKEDYISFGQNFYEIQLDLLYNLKGSADFELIARWEGDELILFNLVTIFSGFMRKAKSISVTGKTDYTAGDYFKSEDVMLIAEFGFGYKYTIKDFNYSPTTKIGKNATNIYINFCNCTVMHPINVTLPGLIDIAITKMPSETRYLEGQRFDRSGMEVTAYYENDYSETVSDYSVTDTALKAGDKKVTISYTSGGITKTAEQNIRVIGAGGSYFGDKNYANCCVGNNPKWVLATLGVIQNFGGISVGNYTYAVGVNLLYVQQLPYKVKAMCVGMPDGFKFDVQQFVFKDGQDENGDTYKYIDGEGFVHTFTMVGTNEYASTEGMVMLFDRSGARCNISNVNGDTLTFYNGRLVSSVSGVNASITKFYEYDENGRLTKIYDSRQAATYVAFNYDTDSLCLTSVQTVYCGRVVKTLTFECKNRKLSSVTETDGNYNRTLYNLYYDENGNLQTVENAEDNTAVRFENVFDTLLFNEGYKTTRISQGYMDGGVFVEKNHMECTTCNVRTDDKTAVNEVCINSKYGFPTAYLLDGDANIVGAFEGSRLDGYKALERTMGKPVTVSDYDTNYTAQWAEPGKINGENYVKTLNGELNLTPPQNYAESFKDAKNFALTFYVYNYTPVKRLQVKIAINSNFIESVELDTTALEVWQKVKIPFRCPDDGMSSIKIAVSDGMTAKDVLISNIRLNKSESSALYFGDDKFKYIWTFNFVESGTDNLITNLTDETYVTENDIMNTFKRLLYFPLATKCAYVCNGKKLIKYDSLKCGNIMFPNVVTLVDEAGTVKANSINIKTESIDGKTVTKKFITFENNGYKVVTKVTSGDTTSEAEESYDKFDRIIRKKDSFNKAVFDKAFIGSTDYREDECNIITTYEYANDDGSFSKAVTNLKGWDKVDYGEAHTCSGSDYTVTFGGFGGETHQYNSFYGTLDKVTQLGYNISSGKNETTQNILGYAYDDYRENVTAITSKTGSDQTGENSFAYDGNVQTATDGLVTYKTEYDKATDTTTLYIYNGTDYQKLYSVKNNGNTQEHTYYNGTKEYTRKTGTDKYGRDIRYGYEGADSKLGSEAVHRPISKYDVTLNMGSIYFYDSDSNLEKIVQSKDGEERFRVTKISAVETEYKINGEKAYSVSLEYDNNLISPRITKLANGPVKGLYANNTWKYVYDVMGRVKIKYGDDCRNAYTYLLGTSSQIKYHAETLNQIAEIKHEKGLGGTPVLVFNAKYEYNAQGMISKSVETYGALTDNEVLTRTYEYDGLNRLTKAASQSKNLYNMTYEYEYSNNGRLTALKENGVARNYSYDKRGRLISSTSEDNADKMYKYEYDSFGNRTAKKKVINTDQCTYSWTNGRLSKFVKTGTTAKTAKYVYEKDGLRFSKEVDGVTTEYFYHGTKLIGENRSDGKRLRYYYDQEGICGFEYYDGEQITAYSYVKNVQGDIVLIKNSSGVDIVRYIYDPWGNVEYKIPSTFSAAAKKSAEEIAEINPFRYRGYYYDTESNLYYLITRYYDPYDGVFISPDSFDYLDPNTIGGLNLYSYCNYNPINYVDPTGEAFFTIFLIIAGIVAGGVVTGLMSGANASNGESFGSAFLGGFVNGIISGVTLAFGLATGSAIWGGVIAVTGGMVGGIFGNAISQAISYGNVDWKVAGIAGLFNAGTNLMLYLGLYNAEIFSTAATFALRFMQNLIIDIIPLAMSVFLGTLPGINPNDFRGKI